MTSQRELSARARSRETCRVVLVGGNRPRVARVMALIQANNDNEQMALHLQQSEIISKQIGDETEVIVDIDFLPCVATFDSYEGDKGEQIRYLVSVDYHGPNGTTKSPSSLLPFFDEVAEKKEDESTPSPLFSGVSGVAVGMGIENDEDVCRIEDFFKTMSSSATGALAAPSTDEPTSSESRVLCPIAVRCIQPSPEFATMREELEVFKALDAEGKAEATRLGTMGPGKMAKFAQDFAQELVTQVWEDRKKNSMEEPSCVEEAADTVPDVRKVENSPGDGLCQNEPQCIDPEKNRYSCRSCRTILFGEDDLQDPPHVPSRHQFSARKRHHGGMGSDGPCQSLFLQSAMGWMGNEMVFGGGTEGKLSCPSCHTKVGNWNWSGAQCSCGTWVVPAIQVPMSKVDLISPYEPALPVGTVASFELPQGVQQPFKSHANA